MRTFEQFIKDHINCSEIEIRPYTVGDNILFCAECCGEIIDCAVEDNKLRLFNDSTQDK